MGESSKNLLNVCFKSLLAGKDEQENTDKQTESLMNVSEL